MKKCVKRHAVTQPLDQFYKIIPLTKGQNALVDAADFDWLNQWNWQATWFPSVESFYATRRNEEGRIVQMAAVIVGCKGAEEPDHRNHNSLDNRRANLRRCTAQQNMFNRPAPCTNTSGFKGVSWHTKTSKWRARIMVGRKEFYLGLFQSKEEAARAHDAAAKLYHGEFAHLNFPQPTKPALNS